MPACADSYQPSLLKKKCSVSFPAPICVLNHLLLVSSTDSLFKQLGPRSDPAKLSCENGAHSKSRMSFATGKEIFFFLFFKCTFLFFNFLSYFIALSFLAGTRLGYYKPRGGTLIFSAYVGSDPVSTVHPPKNIRNFKHPKKIFEILATQKIFQFCTLTLKKDPKLHRNDPQTSPIL